MSRFFVDILNLSITASWVIAAALIIRLLIGKRLPKWVSCTLWALVGIRLIIPFSFESEFSLIPSSETLIPEAIYGEAEVGDEAPFYDNEVSLPLYETDNGSTEFPENNQTEVPEVNGDVGSVVTDKNPLTPPPAVEQQPPPEYIHSGFDSFDDRINPIIQNGSTNNKDTEKVSIKAIIETASYVWLVGIALMLIYAVVNYLLLKKRVAISVPKEDSVRYCEAVGSPFILGLFSPTIYLPYGLSKETEEHVIAHERAHLKRFDHLIKPFGFAVLTVYWFNPLVWVAYILLCRDIEFACDEKVVKNMAPEARKAYAAALLECGVKRTIIAACPVAFGEISVKSRIKSALNYKKPVVWILISAFIICCAFAVFFLTGPKSNSADSQEGEDVSQTEDNQESEILNDESNENIGNIEFSAHAFSGTLKRNGKETENHYSVVVKNRETLNEFIGDDTSDEFVNFANNLGEDYFDEKSLIITYAKMTNGRRDVEIGSVYNNGTAVDVTLVYRSDLKNNNNEQHIILVVENDIEVIKNIDTANVIFEERILKEEDRPSDEALVSFKQLTFGGTISSLNKDSSDTANIGWFEIVKNNRELDKLVKEYSQGDNGADFNGFAKSLSDDYFESKLLVIFPADSQSSQTVFNIKRVNALENNLKIAVEIDSSKAFDESPENHVVAVELNKSEIPSLATASLEVSNKERSEVEFSFHSQRMHINTGVGHRQRITGQQEPITYIARNTDDFYQARDLFYGTTGALFYIAEEPLKQLNKNEGKAWILIQTTSDKFGTAFNIESVYFNNGQLTVNVAYGVPRHTADTLQAVCLIAEISADEAANVAGISCNIYERDYNDVADLSPIVTSHQTPENLWEYKNRPINSTFITATVYNGEEYLANRRYEVSNFAVAGAKVWLIDSNDNLLDYVYTNSKGEATFAVQPGIYGFYVEGNDDYVSVYSRERINSLNSAAKTEIFTYSDRHKNYAVHVVDQETKQPIANAKVELGSCVVYTDKNGNAVLDPLIKHCYYGSSIVMIKCSADGYGNYTYFEHLAYNDYFAANELLIELGENGALYLKNLTYQELKDNKEIDSDDMPLLYFPPSRKTPVP